MPYECFACSIDQETAHGCSDDGVKDWLAEIIDEVLAQNVRFCTIAFSSAADQYLEEIAAR